MFGGFSPDIVHRLALNISPFTKIGKRRLRDSSGGRSPAGIQLFGIGFNIFRGNPSAFPVSGNLGDINADLTRESAHGRCRGNVLRRSPLGARGSGFEDSDRSYSNG